MIFACRKGSPLQPNNVLNRHLKPACDRLGIPRLGFHALRWGVTTEQAASGTDVITMQGWLGHKDPAATLLRYAMADHRRMRAAVEARGEKSFTTVHQNALSLNNTKSQAPGK